MTLVRSPTFTKRESPPTLSGSRPERRSFGSISGTMRGLNAETCSTISRIWSGVVPQQPPVMLSQPLSAHSRMKPAVSHGCSSYSAIALGNPALGCAETKTSAMRESSSTCGRSCLAPRAQLSPTDSGLAWRTEFQNASVVWPESVRPDASVMVPEIMIGSFTPASSKCSSIAKSAALAFNVSKIVSTRIKSTPPSTSAFTATLYASFTWSKLTARKPGSFTSGESESVRFIGPRTPATKRGLPGVRAVYVSATSRAMRAPSRFSSATMSSSP